MVAMCLLGGMLGYWNIAASDVRCNRRANKSEWKFQIYIVGRLGRVLAQGSRIFLRFAIQLFLSIQ